MCLLAPETTRILTLAFTQDPSFGFPLEGPWTDSPESLKEKTVIRELKLVIVQSKTTAIHLIGKGETVQVYTLRYTF